MITVTRYEVQRYLPQDIVFTTNDPPCEVSAAVYVLAEIEDAGQILELAKKHRVKNGEKCTRTARFAVRTRQGAKLLLPGKYRIGAVQSVCWGYGCIVKYRYKYCLTFIDPAGAPEPEAVVFDGIEQWAAADWFSTVTRETGGKGKPHAHVDD